MNTFTFEQLITLKTLVEKDLGSIRREQCFEENGFDDNSPYWGYIAYSEELLDSIKQALSQR